MLTVFLCRSWLASDGIVSGDGVLWLYSISVGASLLAMEAMNGRVKTLAPTLNL